MSICCFVVFSKRAKGKGGWRTRKTVQYSKQEGGWETEKSCDPPILKEQVGGGKKKLKNHPFQRRGRSEEKKKIVPPLQEGRGRSKGKERKIIVHQFQRKWRLASIYK
jgi:hypothetical protein